MKIEPVKARYIPHRYDVRGTAIGDSIGGRLAMVVGQRYKARTLNLRLTAIVAMTPDRVIGRAGALPWHLPEDLAFFKRMTSGHPIVMGRKTYESIGKPLPKRRNIVLTRDASWSAPGVEVIHRPEDLAELPDLDGQVFVIGGSEIYSAFMERLDDLLVSHVFEEHEGDTRFPEFESAFPGSEVMERHEAFEVRRWSRRRQD